MASLALNLTRLNRAQTISLANLGASTMAPAAPATPPIAGIATEVASMATASTAADASVAAWEAANASVATLKAAMDAAMDTLRGEMRAVGSVVEGKAKGDPTILTKSGWPLAGAPVPSTLPAQIMNLIVTASSMDGALDVSWDPEVNSVNYEIEVTTVDPVAGPYVRKPSETSSTTSIPGLTSGQRAWVRVRGHGTKGEGPWSDPGTKIVP